MLLGAPALTSLPDAPGRQRAGSGLLAPVARAEGGVGEDLRGRAADHGLRVAVEEEDLVREAADQRQVVGHDEDGEVVVAAQAVDEGQRLALGDLVHRRGRLVEDGQLGLADEEPRHQHLLLLTLGELAEGDGRQLGGPHLLERGGDQAPPLAADPAGAGSSSPARRRARPRRGRAAAPADRARPAAGCSPSAAAAGRSIRRPLIGGSSPSRVRNQVVLPAPFRPTTAQRSLWQRERSIGGRSGGRRARPPGARSGARPCPRRRWRGRGTAPAAPGWRRGARRRARSRTRGRGELRGRGSSGRGRDDRLGPAGLVVVSSWS